MPRTYTYPSPFWVLRSSLEFVLNNNVFVFNGQHYTQKFGVAMGTKLAPALATLILHYFEQDYLASVVVWPRLYLSYIEGIFVIWDGSEDSLNQFVGRLNSLKPHLKFTATVDPVPSKFEHTDKMSARIHYKLTNNFNIIYKVSPSTHLRSGSE